MIIIGHPWIESPVFRKVFNQKEIQKTNPHDIVLLEPLNESFRIAQYCQKHNIAYAVTVNTLAEALYANGLGADYIICEEDDAPDIQSVATEYLFDTKVLVLIHTEKEMTKAAQNGIDGVIFHEAIC